ncbi:MAG TPA: PadR family transcriptional regulator [Oscillatoriaceae cyanobacterium M33_DOE_052]|uniref:PadR family transcriptional regulator n=1 Tax=Oscillatoriales cyanobacterium SpSt-418 TaxID=2282169 RepID=A0A7C3PHG6_9CYAN|nr:PadR family transcriptional regulator [Oscillatoriaceae cyanobacterium M33_DOE_052]
MSLAFVILGLLQQQQRTGYGLKTECFDDCIAHLWQADQAQIYRTLDKLEAQGFVTCTVEIQHDRPNRKIYTLTEAGTAAFTQWLQTHHPSPTLREPLLVQLHFAAQLSDVAIAHLLEQELEARQEKLAACEALQNMAPAESNLSPDDLSSLRGQTMQRLVLELMIQREKVYLDWLQTAIATIQPKSESKD